MLSFTDASRQYYDACAAYDKAVTENAGDGKIDRLRKEMDIAKKDWDIAQDIADRRR